MTHEPAALVVTQGLIFLNGIDPGHTAFVDGRELEGSPRSVSFAGQFLCTTEERQKVALSRTLHRDSSAGFRSLDRIYTPAQTFEVRKEHVQFAVHP